MTLPQNCSLKSLLAPYPPKAGHLIVTIYGDIVEPRGTTLWVGDLITLCGQFGVNESLVRTAVSRLVNRDQLKGEREGRRSYYSLTPQAKTAFHVAGDQIFGPRDTDCALMFVIERDRSRHDDLVSEGFGQSGDNLFIGADRPGQAVSGARFRAYPDHRSRPEIVALLDKAFDLKSLGVAYSDFVERFSALNDVGFDDLVGLDALTIRLGMVHAFRAIRLIDPRLPPSVLPENWPGQTARALFAKTYIRLSEIADSFIGQNLSGLGALLPEHSSAVVERLEVLQSKD